MIYLASNSPRRAQLLEQIGVPFLRVHAAVEEEIQTGEAPQDYVVRLAREKAQAGFKNSARQHPALGADTIIVIEQQVLEKPRDQEHARKMLVSLSGRTHQVLTAIAIADANSVQTQLVTTEVSFKVLTAKEIADYWLTEEPLDKAGGYAIQGIAGKFVTNMSGSYSAVVGLPLYETEQLIKDFQRK